MTQSTWAKANGSSEKGAEDGRGHAGSEVDLAPEEYGVKLGFDRGVGPVRSTEGDLGFQMSSSFDLIGRVPRAIYNFVHFEICTDMSIPNLKFTDITDMVCTS
jgi:hypothetical protein